MANIFIVEDHPVMRQGLRSLLEREADLTICGEAPSGEAALEQIGPPLPDLVLIDVSLPGMSGIELARSLRERYPGLPLAMLSGHGEKSHVEQALAAGASGYILKGHAVNLPAAVRQVMGGKVYLSPEVASAHMP